MPGLIISIPVRAGEQVKAGQELLVLEAMKMENVLRAERDGGRRSDRGRARRHRRRRSGADGVCAVKGSMRLPLEGGCLCGAVRYRITAEPLDAGYCHCRMCQRSTGAPVVAWLTTPSAGFGWTKGVAAVHRSSPAAERLFCPTCGSQLVFREPGAPDYLDVTLASLDEPEAFPPEHHIWTSSRIIWFETADDLPRHPERDPDGPG